MSIDSTYERIKGGKLDLKLAKLLSYQILDIFKNSSATVVTKSFKIHVDPAPKL